MLPKKGRKLHPWSGLAKSAKDYGELIADALRREHDDTHRTVKTIMCWTGASERSVKNWLSGESGPSGYFLMRLCLKSVAVRALILELLMQPDMGVAQDTRRFSGSSEGKPRDILDTGVRAITSNAVELDGVTLRDNDVTESDTERPTLNRRQEWFLARVASGASDTVDDISTQWLVSKRTAKRDLARLRRLGLIVYSRGHYRGIDQG